MPNGAVNPPLTHNGASSTQDEVNPNIKLATYNIVSGRGSRLEMALREMERMNVDFGFLTEAKITDGIYVRSAYGYRTLATEAVSPHKGGLPSSRVSGRTSRWRASARTDPTS